MRARERQRSAERGRHVLRRLARKHRRERRGRAFTHGANVEARNRGRQQADIGQHRETSADAGIVVEKRHAVGFEQRTQAVALAGNGRLGEAEKERRDIAREIGRVDGRKRRGRLHQSLRRAAGFRDRDEARIGKRQPRQHVAKGLRVEIVEEMQPRPVAQQAKAGHRIAAQLRQRLSTQARPAGAEEDNVARALAQAFGGFRHLVEIRDLFGQAQQRQLGVGVAAAQPVERARGVRQRRIEALLGNSAANAIRKRIFNGLDKRHSSLRKKMATLPVQRRHDSKHIKMSD